MFDKDILYSIKKMIDHAKGDHKISEVNILSYSPRFNRDEVAPSYDDAVNDNNLQMVSFVELHVRTSARNPSLEIWEPAQGSIHRLNNSNQASFD